MASRTNDRELLALVRTYKTHALQATFFARDMSAENNVEESFTVREQAP